MQSVVSACRGVGRLVGRSTVHVGLGIVLLAVVATGCTGQSGQAYIPATTRSSLVVVSAPSPTTAAPGDSPVPSAITTQGTARTFSAAEHAAKMAQCMRDQGWAVEPNGSGGYSIQYPDDQADQYKAAEQACLNIYGNGLPVADEKYASDVYDRLLVVAKCVRAAGYPIDEPPSKATFVEKLMAYPIPICHPYYRAADSGQLAAVQAACPIHE